MGIGLAALDLVVPAYNVASLNEAISPHYLHHEDKYEGFVGLKMTHSHILNLFDFDAEYSPAWHPKENTSGLLTISQ